MAKMSKRGMTKKFLISEMDRSIKRMLKLIGEEGDSFAKKAEIYYQKRPVLVSQVEEFYRMFRSLAERYDNATSELKRCLPPMDPRLPGSGGAEAYSEPPSTMTSPDRKFTRRLSDTRTIAAFDSLGNKDGYETSAIDSGSDSDDSLFNSFSSASNYGNYRRLRKKITELEAELRKVQMEHEENRSNAEIAYYEEELRIAKEKIRTLEEEIEQLRTKLEKYETGGLRTDSNDRSHSDDEMEFVKRENSSRLWKQNSQPQEQISKLLKVRAFNDTIREWERYRCLEEDLRRVENQKNELEEEIEDLKAEKEVLAARVGELEEETSIKDEQIDHIDDRMQKLRLECEKTSRSMEELRRQSQELEIRIEKQQEVIEEGAEEKQQAVRQLYISLEHYRNAYQMLRQDLLEQRKPVMAS